MLSELTVAISRLCDELQRLQDERELFVMANDEVLHEFIFEKKLKEYDNRIAELEGELRALEQERLDVIDAEAEELKAARTPDPDAFEKKFEELSHVDGIDTCETFDEIVDMNDGEDPLRDTYDSEE